MTTARRIPAGIRERHARSCRSHAGGECSCSPTYQAQTFDTRTGRRLWRTAATLSEAKLWRQDAAVAIRRGELSADRGPRLSDAIEAWLAVLEQESTRSGDPYKPGTIRDYRRTVHAHQALEQLGHLRVRELRTADAQRWVDGLVKGAQLSPATIDTAVTPWKAFYRRALVRGDATVNPFAGILKPAVRSGGRRVAGAVDVAAMVAALEPADARLWACAFYSGLRRGELIGLRASDVDLASGVLRVERGWDMGERRAIAPKSRRGKRNVPIPAVLRDVLDELVLERVDPLLGSPSWIAHTNDRARERWTERGLPVLTLHEARHTYASLMIAAGVNAKALSTFMGHANIAVTLDLYGHLMPGSEDQSAVLLDRYLAHEIGAAAAPTVAQNAAHPLELALQSA